MVNIFRKLKMKYKVLFLILIIILIGFSVSKSREIIINKKNQNLRDFLEFYQESVYPEDVYGTRVNTQIIPLSDNARPGTKRIIKYIVIHETDNFKEGVRSLNHANYLSYNNNTYTSWHYTVDDTEIYHHMPDDEIAYHAGERSGNLYGIGIELCVNADGDFSKTVINAAKLVAYLLKAYNLDIRAIKTHHDFNGKDCPHTILQNNALDKFKEIVKEYLKVDQNKNLK